MTIAGRIPFAAVLAAAALAAAGFVALHRAGAHDGLPDAAGAYLGRVSFQTDSLDGGVKTSHGSYEGQVHIFQNGESVEFLLTIEAAGGQENYDLVGKIGDGALFASNGDLENPVFASAKVTGSGTKLRIKGTCYRGGPDGTTKYSLNFHRN